MMPAPEVVAAFRFGTGLPLPADAPGTPAALRAGLAAPDAAAAAHLAPRTAEVLAATAAAFEARRAARRAGEGGMMAPGMEPGMASGMTGGMTDGMGGADEEKATRAVVDRLRLDGARAQIARAIDAPDGFRERLARFWADHFTVRNRAGLDSALPGAFVEDAIRPYLGRRFADLLRAATLHPAMLAYLDQVSSVGPNSELGRRRGRGLNENLARELIELHTLGVGAAYTQADVRELAELLTGLGVDSGSGTVFRPDWAEPGAETVLGTTYGPEGIAPVEAVLADLAARPETAGHIARKLAVHFVADDPPPALVADLAAVFRATGGDLPALHGALADHPAAWSAPLTKLRQPFEHVVAGLRALGVSGAQVMALPRGPLRRHLILPMARMGQPWQAPRGPDGWPEAAEAWVTPQLLAARIEWALEAPQRLVPELPDPADLARRALGPMAEGRVEWAASRAETRAEGVALVLSAPAFKWR